MRPGERRLGPEYTEFVTGWLPEIEELSVEIGEGEKPGGRELDVFVRDARGGRF